MYLHSVMATPEKNLGNEVLDFSCTTILIFSKRV